jgi:hypothetical protein
MPGGHSIIIAKIADEAQAWRLEQGCSEVAEIAP